MHHAFSLSKKATPEIETAMFITSTAVPIYILRFQFYLRVKRSFTPSINLRAAVFNG